MKECGGLTEIYGGYLVDRQDGRVVGSGCTPPQKMFPCLQTVHEVLGVDVDVGVEHVEPLGQVLLHGVQVLVRPGETPQLSLLHQL